MDKELIERAKEIIKDNRNSIEFPLLKRKLHIGIVTCNNLVNELEKLGVVEITDDVNYKIKVMI